MRAAGFVCLVGFVFGVPSIAQVRPQPGSGDTRIQSIEYRADQIVRIEGTTGYQVSIQLAPDEQVQSIALGDSGAWQVTANKAGNYLFLKPLQLGVATNMTVITDVRTYAFDLVGAAEAGAMPPYMVRFHYPVVANLEPAGSVSIPARGAEQFSGKMIGIYRLRGDRLLRPSAISDDGIRTFIEWPADVPLPAVYSRDAGGRETLVNGNMRGTQYVIDSVLEHVLFRIDKRTARADRAKTKGS